VRDGKTKHRETRGLLRAGIQHFAGDQVIKRVNGFHVANGMTVAAPCERRANEMKMKMKPATVMVSL
jgi:hypothetical protein